MLLYPHQDVENYFDVVDAANLDVEAARKVAAAYEDGRAILLRNLKPDFDPDFFAGLSWVDGDILKKLKSVQVVQYHDAVVKDGAPAHDPRGAKNSPAAQYSHILRDVFHDDTGRMAEFVENMRSINSFMQSVIDKIFPSYRYTRHSFTWRCSDTINENLHLDVYKDDLPDHHVRMFINLDNVHRIWHTSHRLEWLLQHYLDQLPRELVSTGTPGRICHALNFLVFGGFDVAGREGAPKHICFFAPGEVWLVDSRKVSHQIFYGRRAVSTEFQVDPASMLDPSKHYFNLVEQHRARLLRAAA